MLSFLAAREMFNNFGSNAFSEGIRFYRQIDDQLYYIYVIPADNTTTCVKFNCIKLENIGRQVEAEGGQRFEGKGNGVHRHFFL